MTITQLFLRFVKEENIIPQVRRVLTTTHQKDIFNGDFVKHLCENENVNVTSFMQRAQIFCYWGDSKEGYTFWAIKSIKWHLFCLRYFQFDNCITINHIISNFEGRMSQMFSRFNENENTKNEFKDIINEIIFLSKKGFKIKFPEFSDRLLQEEQLE